MSAAYEKVRALPIWSGPVDPVPLPGGTTNLNFLVQDGSRRLVVRIGEDIALHMISRANELGASRAAHAAGVSPAVVYHAPGVLVTEFMEATTLTAADLHRPGMLARVLPVLAQAHRAMPLHLRGATQMFWVFHVIRDYAATLHETHAPEAADLPALLNAAAVLEAAVGPVDLVYGHNDLLPANLLDDGARIWLIDWDYGGWNSPLFDLGGLAANCALTPAQEAWMLEAYFARPPSGDLWRRYHAMKCAAALREALWNMVSRHHSALAVDFGAQAAANLATFHAAYADFTQG